jgi:hypothetical protein
VYIGTATPRGDKYRTGTSVPLYLLRLPGTRTYYYFVQHFSLVGLWLFFPVLSIFLSHDEKHSRFWDDDEMGLSKFNSFLSIHEHYTCTLVLVLDYPFAEGFHFLLSPCQHSRVTENSVAVQYKY